MRKIAPLGQSASDVAYFEVEIDVTDAEASLLQPRISATPTSSPR